MKTKTFCAALALALAGEQAAHASSEAAGMPTWAAPSFELVSLSASASMEVVQDWLSATLSTQKDGTDPATVQRQLNQALTSALEHVRAQAAPGQLEVSTGAVNVAPRYGKEGRILGWVGTAELLVAGRDLALLATVLGRAPGMTVAQLRWSVSPTLRQRVEDQVQAQAVQRFRARAQALAANFGYGDYRLQQVQVSASDGGGPVLPLMARMNAATAQAESAPLALEAGKALITVTVSGTVQLRR